MCASRRNHERRPTRAHSRWPQLVKFYLCEGFKLCRVNVADERRGFGPSMRRDQLPVWSRLVQVFYFYFTLKLLASLILQHQYNRLTKTLSLVTHGGEEANTLKNIEGALENQARVGNQTSSKNRWSQVDEERAQLDLVIRRLHLIGNAYYEFGAPIEPLYLVLIYICYLAYLQPQIYVAMRRKVTSDLLCAILDPQRYRTVALNPEIERQANRYIGSSGNYLMARLACACPDDEPPASSSSNNPRALVLGLTASGHLIWRRESLRELELAHEREVQQLAALAESGELVPPNRRADRIGQLTQLYGRLVIFCHLLGTSSMVLVFIVLPRLHLGAPRLRSQPRDLLFQAELICYCVLANQCFILHMSRVIMTALDQSGLVVALSKMMDSLAGAPGPVAAAAADAAAGHHQNRVASDRNRGLIRLVIQYELLKRELGSTQANMGFMSANVLMLMLTAPVLARLYVVQIAPEYRNLYLGCSSLVIFGCDMALLPFCRLHARCLDMLHARSRLLSSIDGQLFSLRRRKSSNHQTSLLTPWRASHDEHTVCLLRREQQAPELAVRNFAVDAFFLRLTYVNLLGVHFWCALLLAPMFMRDPARPHGVGDNLLTLLF